MPIKIIFVRHGETIENRDHIVQGTLPGTLSALGRAQAEQAAQKLKGVKLDHIYTSSLRRALDTARTIAKFHNGVPFTEAEELREQYYGSWQGRHREEVGWYQLQEQLWSLGYRPGGGETIEEIYARVERFVQGLAQRHGRATVLVVGHGTSGRLLAAVLTHRPPEAAKEIGLSGNTEITRFELPPEREKA